MLRSTLESITTADLHSWLGDGELIGQLGHFARVRVVTSREHPFQRVQLETAEVGARTSPRPGPRLLLLLPVGVVVIRSQNVRRRRRIEKWGSRKQRRPRTFESCAHDGRRVTRGSAQAFICRRSQNTTLHEDIITRCYRNGSDRPHRRHRRTNRSIVFARWRQWARLFLGNTRACTPQGISIDSVSFWWPTHRDEQNMKRLRTFYVLSVRTLVWGLVIKSWFYSFVEWRKVM